MPSGGTRSSLARGRAALVLLVAAALALVAAGCSTDSKGNIQIHTESQVGVVVSGTGVTLDPTSVPAAAMFSFKVTNRTNQDVFLRLRSTDANIPIPHLPKAIPPGGPTTVLAPMAAPVAADYDVYVVDGKDRQVGQRAVLHIT